MIIKFSEIGFFYCNFLLYNRVLKTLFLKLFKAKVEYFLIKYLIYKDINILQ